MVKRNKALANLAAGYLFPEVARRRREFEAAHSGELTAKNHVISLGIGNTTEPLMAHIAGGLQEGAGRLRTAIGYTGYTDEGFEQLRQGISAVYYGGKFGLDEIFVSDGAKCDIGRLQLLFGPGTSACVQDPAYPVYVDGSVLVGAAGGSPLSSPPQAGGIVRGYAGITYMPCTPENDFFPDLSRVPPASLIYFCSPNNPTGATATKAQLTALVKTAREKGCIIIFDAAYSAFIRDESLPKSIFEIDGARECAIEVQSFSKPAGFTGVRLGWTVVPKELKYEGGASVNADWSRIMSTVFNGASNIAQWGGITALDADGQRELRAMTDFYLGNAALIRAALEKKGVACVGGDNSPYIWARFPGEDSWDVFNRILEKCHVVTTPGSGFGPAGQSFIRFSAFGHRPDVEEACKRLTEYL
jgi:LL-diaminopimelate aminotransferase